jgi:hypothetical protein
MARRSPTLVDGEPPSVAFSKNDWKGFEGVYRKGLPPDVRIELEQATNSYLSARQFEVEGKPVPINDVRGLVSSIRSHATTLRDALSKRKPGISAPAFLHADFTIGKHFAKLIGNETTSYNLHYPMRIVALLVKACVEADAELREPAQSWSAWNEWVNNVSLILAARGLRHGADKRTATPLTDLLMEIEKHFPVEYRRAVKQDSYAQAVLRARSPKVKKALRDKKHP